MERKKITIVGAGRVGSTAAFIAATKELGDILLLNRTRGKAIGLALDMMEATPLCGCDAEIVGTNDFMKTKNSDIVVITAGAQRKAGMQRSELLERNAAIIQPIAKKLAKYSPNAIMIVVTNPLDAMAYLAYKVSKFHRSRVIGMAGILDTSRYKSFIAHHLKVSVEDVSAIVLGGHGDSMIPLPGHTSVNGIPLTELLSKKEMYKIIERTRNAGAEIIRYQKDSSAYFSPGASIVELIEAIVKDKKRVLPCAAFLKGEYGLNGLFMGVPVRIGAKGIEKIIELKLDGKEQKELMQSAQKVKKTIKELSL